MSFKAQAVLSAASAVPLAAFTFFTNGGVQGAAMALMQGAVANAAASYVVSNYAGGSNMELKTAAGTGALLGAYAYFKEPGIPPFQAALLGAGLCYLGDLVVTPMAMKYAV